MWHAPVAAAALDDAQYAALVARFQSAVDAERARYSVPGITAAFVLSDGRVAKVASGFADVERKVRHDARLTHARRQHGQDSGGCGGHEVVAATAYGRSTTKYRSTLASGRGFIDCRTPTR